MAEVLWNTAYEVVVITEWWFCSISLCNQGSSQEKVLVSCSILVPLFSSSGERAIVLVFVHWHAEVLLKEGRFVAELQAGIYLNILFPAFKTIIFSCFQH